MTTTLIPPMTSGSIDTEDSVVAVTLSWPMQQCAPSFDAGRRRNAETIVELIGAVDLHLVTRVQPMLAALAAQSAVLVVDTSGVQFIDASGLGLLVAMHREVTGFGGRMQLLGATPTLRRLLRITRLEHMLRDTDDLLDDSK
jgi:anti-anti-sigma factor